MDDCCIFAFDDKTIDDLCLSFGSSFLLKDEGSIEDFLGIQTEELIGALRLRKTWKHTVQPSGYMEKCDPRRDQPS